MPRSRRIAAVAPTVAAAVALAATVLVAAVVAAAVLGAGRHPSGAARAVLATPIIAGPVPIVVTAAAAAALIALAVRRWRLVPAALALGLAVVGVVVALQLTRSATRQDWFGVPLDATTTAWVAAGFGAVGLALGSLAAGPAWRRMVAATAAILALAAATLGVNADFGLQRTLADFAGITLTKHIRLPHASPAPTTAAAVTGPLWRTWHPPAGMPAHGTTGTVEIPATASGFVARPAGLYLPPAALVAHPPALPLVVLMMGQPGNPDPSFTAAALDALAARHEGLAPIVVVADQLGNPAHDTLCLDTARFGKVETYITQDVVGWARSHLHVLQDAAHTVVAGYSNGGECALAFGTKYPQLFGNVLDVSGEAYPGADRARSTLALDFGGNAAAYRATWPATTLARTRYADTVGVFTTGARDTVFGPQARQMVAATTAAGWRSQLITIPGGHVGAALVEGSFGAGFGALYGRLDLMAPGATA